MKLPSNPVCWSFLSNAEVFDRITGKWGKKLSLYKAVELFQNLVDLSAGNEPLAGSPSLGSS